MINTTITDNNDDDIDRKLDTFSVRFVLPSLLVIFLLVTAFKNKGRLSQSLVSCKETVKNQFNKRDPATNNKDNDNNLNEMLL